MKFGLVAEVSAYNSLVALRQACMIGGEKACSLVPPASSFLSAAGLPWSYFAIIQLLAAWPACSMTL